MKRILLMMLVVVLGIVLAACTQEKESYETSYTTTSDNEADLEITEEMETEENISSETESSVEWKAFLGEYEDWVDNYIEILAKYQANPQDMSVLSDYTEMMTEFAEWSEKADEVQQSLENVSPQEAAEYAAEVARIAGKIAQAAY